jgi:2-polyprenyl-3-methyl-5-hydroxy-6-metoxy-1,4-benzoquinol methylase
LLVKNSWHLDPALSHRYRRMAAFDRAEIDNPDQHDAVALHYYDRLRTVLARLREHFPDLARTRIAELGCAQGNIALLLAEQGYAMVAVDRDPEWLRYAQLKHERGAVEWLAADLGSLPLAPGSLDAAVLGEVITTTPEPERMLAAAARCVREGGLVLVTVPNGQRLRLRLPSLAEMRAARSSAAEPATGHQHLFKMTAADLAGLLPPSLRVERAEYCGGTALINRFSAPLLRALPLRWARWMSHAAARVPLLNRYTARSCCFLLRKARAVAP